MQVSVPKTGQVIVIGRQFGSGGHDLGQELAQRLGYAFYDKDIIKMTAGTTGYSTQYIEKSECSRPVNFPDLLSLPSLQVYSG